MKREHDDDDDSDFGDHPPPYEAGPASSSSLSSSDGPVGYYTNYADHTIEVVLRIENTGDGKYIVTNSGTGRCIFIVTGPAEDRSHAREIWDENGKLLLSFDKSSFSMTNKTSGFDPAAGKRIGSKPVFTYRYFSANSAKVKFLNQCGLDPKQKICLHVQTYRDPGKAVVSTPRGKKVADLQTSAESDTMTITAAPGLDLVLMTAIALVHQGAGHACDTRDNTTRQVNPRSTDPLLRSSVGTVLFAGSLPGSGTGL